MSKFNLESAFSELSQQVASLTAKIIDQSATIEAQSKKLEDQQLAINNFSVIITEQKRVVEQLVAKVEERSGKREGDAPTVTTPRVSETAAAAAIQERAWLSPNITLRSHQTKKKAKPMTIEDVTQNPTGLQDMENKDASIPNNVANTSSGKWTLVSYQNKAKNGQLNNIQKGGNTQISSFQAVENKKFLHVWSLHPDTTEEAITEHVSKTCGSGDVKIQKITPKTKRDYSSFMIGVPELKFDTINNIVCWPVNTKFNEWVWFRDPRKTPKAN